MKTISLLTCLLFISCYAYAAEKCIPADKLPEGSRLMKMAIARDYKELPKDLAEICEKYKGRLTCSIETVKNELSGARSRELVKGDKCAAVYSVENGKSETTLYFISGLKAAH